MFSCAELGILSYVRHVVTSYRIHVWRLENLAAIQKAKAVYEVEIMKGRIEIINMLGESVSVSVVDDNGTVTVTIDRPEDKIVLSSLCPGDIFRAGGTEYIVLAQHESGTASVVRRDPLEGSMVFDPHDNNWKTSGVRAFLNGQYLETLTETFGLGNITDCVTDMLSLDGLNDFGKCVDKISLLDIDQYRKYRKYLGQPLDRPWWLVTPDSAPSGFSGNSVLYVGEAGDIGVQPCSFSGAVRPFLTLRSDVCVELVRRYEVGRWR